MHQINKVAKHIQTIHRQFADELFECVWPFCGIGAYRVNSHIVVSVYFRRLGNILFAETCG